MKHINLSGLYIGLATILVIGGGFLLHAVVFSEAAYKAHAEDTLCTSRISDAVPLTASSGYVLSLKTGEVLYEKDAHAQMPLASLTKLMTTLVAAELLDIDGVIPITAEAFAPEGDSGFVENELWEVKDLIDFTLITSSNDGAHALALAVKNQDRTERGRNNFDFVSAMNAKALQLGLAQTFFLNDTGLDVSLYTAGAYGSAYDVAQLLSHVHNEFSDVFSASATVDRTFISVSGIAHVAEHTSGVPGAISGEVIAKTGFTDLAGGNLGIVGEPLPGHPVAIVVLGSTLEERDNDVLVLYEESRKALKRATLCTI